MLKTLAQGDVTFDDFCFLTREWKADLIDGVIYMASPASVEVSRLLQWLIGLSDGFVTRKDIGEVFGNRIAFRLDEFQSPEPDLGFVQKKRLNLVRKAFIDGPPDAAIEIVDRESVDRDYILKRRQYERYGVREYWIIDPLAKAVKMLRLNQSGTYRSVRPSDGNYYSEVIDGFWLDPNWLWQSPRPRKSAILAKLLGA